MTRQTRASSKPYGEEDTAVIKAIKRWKIRNQLLAAIVLGGILGFSVFGFLWFQEPNVWRFCQRFPVLSWDSGALFQALKEKAKETVVPDAEGSQEDAEDAFAAVKDFLDLRDEYTSIYLYNTETGLYIAGAYASMMDEILERGIFDIGYRVTGGSGEMYFSQVMQFKNCAAEVVVFSYHRSKIAYPYFLISAVLGILVFLAVVLHFISRKMRSITRLKDAILRMAEGDLQQVVPSCGEDEIGILAHELDQLRITLDENIQQEAQSRRANQDLITVMSHDLRTPLTILNGYLEILKLGRNDPKMQEEYLERCLRKTADIKEMTDKMFEYALVFEDREQIHPARLDVNTVRSFLEEHCDFIRLAGFDVRFCSTASMGTVMADAAILKRVFTNLFSNILKYGDKKQAVTVQYSIERDMLRIVFFNAIRQDQAGVESNRIGLRSVEKMVTMHHGSFYVLEEDGTFMVKVMLPLYTG